jgi:hypothetical protein
MVVLAKSPSGNRKTGAYQIKNATVMLGSGPINLLANVIQSLFRGGSDERVVSAERAPNGSDRTVFSAGAWGSAR